MKTFDELFAELSVKAETRPAGSGTVAELDGGVHTIGKKIVEEAAEAGADTFVAGSAIYGADDVEAAVSRLRDLARAASLES